MINPKGELSVTARGQSYTLYFSMSVIAKLQSKHGRDVMEQLEPPEGASRNWLPDMAIVCDIIGFSLECYHADEATRWLADHILDENPTVIRDIIKAAYPDASKGNAAGNGRKPKKAASI